MAKARRESVLESRAVKYARSFGVQVAKLTQLDGIPDRVFFVDGGRPLIVEFKRAKKTPGPLQRWHLAALRMAGYDAHYCDNWEEFLDLWNRTVRSPTKK